jgi:hypothetical protein
MAAVSQEEARRRANEYIDAYFQLVSENQSEFLKFLRDRQEEELYHALVDPIRIGRGGLLVHFNEGGELPYYEQRVHGKEDAEEYAKRPYLFHGTKATVDILKSWRLLQHDPGDGGPPAIFFGQTFQTSIPYASDYGIGNTRKRANKQCASVMVFRNNPEQRFHTKTFPGIFAYELLMTGVPDYPLDSLEAILIRDEPEDGRALAECYAELPQDKRDRFEQGLIKVYDVWWRSLNHEEVVERVSDVFRRRWDQIIKDPELFFWPLAFTNEKCSISTKVYSDLMGLAETFNGHYMKMVMDSAVCSGAYDFVEMAAQRIRARSATAWVDYLLLEVQGKTVLGRLIWDMIVDLDRFDRLVDRQVYGSVDRRIWRWAAEHGKKYINPKSSWRSEFKLESIVPKDARQYN